MVKRVGLGLRGTENMFKMGFLGKVIPLLFILDFTSSDSLNLYGADPRGGLWAAKLDLGRNFSTTAELKMDRFALLEDNIDIASYDHATKSVLLRTFHNTASSIFFGPVCHHVSPPQIIAELDVVPLQDDQLGDCVNCEASGFALHNGQLYFLLYGEFFSNNAISRLVQIRVFEACDQCGITGIKSRSDFTFHDMIECSSVVSEILREQFSFSDYDNMEVKGGKGMKVVQHGDHTSFFFLLGNITRFDEGHDKVSMSLWYADDKGHQKELHTEELKAEFSAWDIRALGSLDYNHHNICWTAGDRILCAEYSDHHLHHQVVLMTPEEAAASGACLESTAETIRISGVAITRTGGHNVVVFGCHPEDPELGGTGIIYFSDEYKHFQAVKTATGPLLAGSVFLEKDLMGGCPSSLDLDVCLGQLPDSGDKGDHTNDHDHSGHLHLDLGQSTEENASEEMMPKGEHMPREENPPNGENTQNSSDQLSTEPKTTDDEENDDDTMFDDNEMPLDKDYKYNYKTQELLMQEEGSKGTAAHYHGYCKYIVFILASVAMGYV